MNCFLPADILLPNPEKTALKHWAVIACDQFTSEPDYWSAVENEIGSDPSAYRLVLPEAMLDNADSLIPKINSAMSDYLKSVFIEYKSSMIYLERTLSTGEVRRGIVGAVDLEAYSYKKADAPLIRASEGTVLERIPPRVAVRHDADIELPHIMLLFDDPDKTVIEPLSAKRCEAPVYSSELMLGGGAVKGRLLTEDELSHVSNALSVLADPKLQMNKYGFDTMLQPMLFAVGDGNHSLASAKAHYEDLKSKLGNAAMSHPARYALTEIVNLHDSSLHFEPIYRIVFGTDPKALLSELSEYAKRPLGNAMPQSVEYIVGSLHGKLVFEKPEAQLTVGTLQAFLDDYASKHPSVRIDYIHGRDSLEKLAESQNAIGFVFDGIEKNELFKTVMLDGVLPRKAFSMGNARDKRYYIEARKIK